VLLQSRVFNGQTKTLMQIVTQSQLELCKPLIADIDIIELVLIFT